MAGVPGTQRVQQLWLQLWANARVRNETLWVIGHRVTEFVLMFVALKVLANLIGQAGFGEYNLAMTALVLIANLTLMPGLQAYLRVYHAAETAGRARGPGRVLLAWYVGVSAAIVVIGLVFSRPMAGWFDLQTWTGLAAGLAFVGYHWRILGIEVLTIQRRRRAVMVQNAGFLAVSIGLTVLLAWRWEATAVAALAGYALAAAAFAAFSVGPFLRYLAGQGAGGAELLRPAVLSFGVPSALLLTCQWVQNFADRFILDAMTDRAAVGAYVAAYQVCGAPYLLLSGVLVTLVKPIAYERSQATDDAPRMWSADKLLLLGTAAYLVLGAAALWVYVLFGPDLVVLLTSRQFRPDWTVVLFLALGRFTQSTALLLETFFAVHHRMSQSLGFRLAGALVTVPACWIATRAFGPLGAALGSWLAATAYVLLLVFGPHGCYQLVHETRRRVRAAG